MMKKIFSLLLVALVITGCTPSSLKKVYKNMKSNEISGYVVNVKAFGKVVTQRYGKELRFHNYKNEQIHISEKVVIDFKNSYFEEYIIEGDKILQKKDNEFKEIESYNYIKYDIYLEGLKNIDKVNSKSKEIINGKENTLYEVTFKTKVLNDILTSLNIENVESKTVVKGRIHYVDGYLTRISYMIEEFSIIAEYSSVDAVDKIKY